VTVYCLVELDGPAGSTAGEPAVVADASLRALTLARGLAGGAGVAAVVFAQARAVPVADLAAYGVTDVHAVAVDGYAPQAWAKAITGLLPGGTRSWAGRAPGVALATRDHDGGSVPVVVAAGTDHGNEVMAHLGAITGLPMAANCVSAVAGGPGGSLSLVRQRWAGLLLEESVLDAPAALLTVATDAVAAVPAPVPAARPADTVPMDAVPMDTVPGEVAVHEVKPALEDADMIVRAEEAPAGAGGASLATARVVVGGGRGVGSAEGFAPLEELASLLGGVVGVSRVVTSEGWRPHTQQVGQTGTKITPDLYLACGISGAIQHIAGCSGAKHIIAINTDPAAPMMARADYAVVGDLREVVPALIAALRAR
jgi:electron transfer flavoprotein alpha subunit